MKVEISGSRNNNRNNKGCGAARFSLILPPGRRHPAGGKTRQASAEFGRIRQDVAEFGGVRQDTAAFDRKRQVVQYESDSTCDRAASHLDSSRPIWIFFDSVPFDLPRKMNVPLPL